MNLRFGSRSELAQSLLVVGLFFLIHGVPRDSTVRAADYDVVGVLAIAVEPEASEQLGLTEKQLAQIQDVIAEKEAEILSSAGDLRVLTPDQRNARLAEFRLATEEAGLQILSAQQRAKLEQMRLKRFGLRVLADPVVARRLQISPEQAATIQQNLARGAPEGASANAGVGAGEEIIQVLNESQRQAFRSMLLGELPANSGAAPNENSNDQPKPNSSGPLADEVLPSGVPPAGEPAAPPQAPADEDDELVPQMPPGTVHGESVQPPKDVQTPAGETPPVVAPKDAAEEPSVGKPTESVSDNATKPAEGGESQTMPDSEKQPSAAEPKPEAMTSEEGAANPVSQPEGGKNETPGAPQATTDNVPAKEPEAGVPSPGDTVSQPPVPTDSATSGNEQSSTPPAPEIGPSQEANAPKPPMPGVPPPNVGETSPGSGSPVWLGPPAGMPGMIPPRPRQLGPGVSSGQSPSGGVASPQLPPADVKLRFNFRFQPWKEVLDWLAQQAGLSLVMDSPPPGTFNYVDDHEFTPAQAIDLLNSVLLTKGYVLVRRERMLMLFNVEDGIPPNLVDTISPEDLEKRGDYEMVSCLFQLRRMTPEEAEQEVKKLTGPQGSVVVLAKAKQLFVTETAGRLKTIRRMLDAIENPSANDTVRTFKINPATVDQVLSIVRQMFQIPADQTANADGTLRFAIDPAASRLLVSGTPEMLDRFSQLLQALDPSAIDGGSSLESTPQLEVYPITSADPQMVLQVFQTLLAGMPDVRLAIDPKTGALVAWARPAQHATIRATLQQLQGEVGQVEVIPLRVVDPQLAVLAISKLFGTTGDSASSNAPTVDADLSTRMLLVRGTKAQIDQIRQLLVKMGEPADASGSANLSLMRTIPMDAGTAQAVLNQMQNIWPQVRSNRLQVIRSVIPSELDRTPSPTNEEEQLRSKDEQTERGVEARRIPLPEAMTAASRLVLGLSPRSATSSTSTTTSTGSTPSPQQPSFPQPMPGQAPFSPPWGPPGGFMPGGGGGFFERRSDSGEHDHGHDRWRGSDRTTYSHSNSVLLASSNDDLHAGRLNDDTLSPEPGRVRATFVSQANGQTGSAGAANDSNTSAQQPTSSDVPAPPPPTQASPPKNVETPPATSSQESPSAPPTPGTGEVPAAPPPVIVAVTPEGLVVASQDPEALNQFESLVRRMASQDVAQYGGPELVVYYLKNSKAESVASILDQILGGGTLTSSGSSGGSLVGEIARAAFGNVGGGLVGSLLGIDTGTSSSSSTTSSTRTTSRIQITPDSRLNALIVQAYPQDLQLIEEILRVLDQQNSPQEVAVQPKTIIIPVKNTQAEEIANILRSVYQDRLVTAASANRGPSPQEIIQLLRGGGRGGPGGGGRNQPQEEVQRMSIGVDVRTNSLIISAPEKLLSEVRQLVEQLDQKAATDSEETTQVVTLQRASPESVRTALSALLGSGVQIRGSTSSSRVTSSSSTGSSGRSSSYTGSRFQPGGFSPFGQMPFGAGGFRPPGQFGSSSQFGGRSGFSGRSGGR